MTEELIPTLNFLKITVVNLCVFVEQCFNFQCSSLPNSLASTIFVVKDFAVTNAAPWNISKSPTVEIEENRIR